MGSQHPSPSINEAIASALARYHTRNPISHAHHESSILSLPGGNTRSLLHEQPFPIIMTRGQHHTLTDMDSHTYIDLVGELTAGLFGHSHPVLLDTLTRTAQEVGLSLGATNQYEARYAELLCKRFGLDRVRFTNSGTEANLHALAAARKFTGRRKVVVMSGGYHGGVLTFGAPVRDRPHDEKENGKKREEGGLKFGQAENNVDQADFVLVEYNDCQGVRDAFRGENGDGGGGGTTSGIAAVLVEPMQGSAGFIPASYEFLRTCQEECEKAGAVFILDEVMTSRLAPGGLQSTFSIDATTGDSRPGIKPGLTTFGKYLGGGMPFGAFGGKAEIMSVYDPRLGNSLFHSGTFQNNTLMLAMGYTALSQVYTPEKAEEHSKRGEELKRRLNEVTAGTKLCVSGLGSLLCIHFGESWGRARGEIESKEKGGLEDEDLRTLFWLEMLESGFWVQRRGSVALILDIPQDALDQFVEAIRSFVEKHRSYLTLEM